VYFNLCRNSFQNYKYFQMMFLVTREWQIQENGPVHGKHSYNAKTYLLAVGSRKREGTGEEQTLIISQDFIAQDTENPAQTGLILKKGTHPPGTEPPRR
jgi:hypothetical protein